MIALAIVTGNNEAPLQSANTRCLIPYESEATRRQRFEIVWLGDELVGIERDIVAFHRAMYAFEREYQRRLGDLAEAVMVLRAQLGLAKSSDDYAGLAVPTRTKLADEQYRQLRDAYRRAAKLCHPDRLDVAHRDIGLQLFDALNKAYHLQDLVRVEDILWQLQSGQAFSETTLIITNAQWLAKRRALLGDLIVQAQDRLAQLKMREAYDIGNRDNWNILLYDYQVHLEDELAILRGRATIANRNAAR